jgi:hypothetical protein
LQSRKLEEMVLPLAKTRIMNAKRDNNDQTAPAPADNKFGVHADVLKLGLVSLLTDLSSEMIFSVFAIFFSTIAGASAALLGLVEGFADFSASSLNYLAGRLSDRVARRIIVHVIKAVSDEVIRVIAADVEKWKKAVAAPRLKRKTAFWFHQGGRDTVCQRTYN